MFTKSLSALLLVLILVGSGLSQKDPMWCYEHEAWFEQFGPKRVGENGKCFVILRHTWLQRFSEREVIEREGMSSYAKMALSFGNVPSEQREAFERLANRNPYLEWQSHDENRSCAGSSRSSSKKSGVSKSAKRPAVPKKK